VRLSCVVDETPPDAFLDALGPAADLTLPLNGMLRHRLLTPGSAVLAVAARLPRRQRRGRHASLSTMDWGRRLLLFLGDDWAEEHHDVELQNESGKVLARAKLPEGIVGMTKLHAMIGGQLGDEDTAEVIVGIETERGPWVQALVAAGYRVYPVNPLQVARFRERLGVSVPRATARTPTFWPTWCARSGSSYGPSPATASRPRRSRWSPAPIRR
jgi:hypothetical protein